MLVDNKLNVIKEWAKQSSREEIAWVSGYLSGLLDKNSDSKTALNQIPSEIPSKPIKPTIVFGTETGNSKKVATQLQVLLKKNKILAKVTDAFQYSIEKIKDEELLIIIMSTQGEGEPPLNAKKFCDNISNLTEDLGNVNFAVLALGDSSYPLFCQAGNHIDTELERLKARRVIPFQTADVDYSSIADSWAESVLYFIQNAQKNNMSQLTQNKQITEVGLKKNYSGKIQKRVILNDIGSNKETYHIEIISNEEIIYQPGDTVGFYPKNSSERLQEILHLFGWSEGFDLLNEKNIRGLSEKSLQKLGQLLEIDIQENRADLLDILKKYPHFKKVDLESVLELLLPIAPRLYSISSSPEAHDGELHITVTKNKFLSFEEEKTGFCSDFLGADALETIDFYIQPNSHFRLPEEDKDIILIGPGTGIAPFRSFLAHRDATGASGRNWLIFGEQYFVSDFYYQTEIQEWLQTGTLTKLDTAFSRDQKQKVYVQHRIRENAETFLEWLDAGAHLYICGQKIPMSSDVENTILEILQSHRNFSETQAKEYLEELENQNRYLKDVY